MGLGSSPFKNCSVVVFEPVFIAAAIVVLIKQLVYLNRLNKINYRINMETTVHDRRAGYVKQLFQNSAFIMQSRVMGATPYFVGQNERAMESRRAVSGKYYRKSIVPSALSYFTGELLLRRDCLDYSLHTPSALTSPHAGTGAALHTVHRGGTLTEGLLDLSQAHVPAAADDLPVVRISLDQ